MVKQERALRTRANVLRAAAAEFNRSGYDGTSLSKVSKAAGMSVGALTFHFSTKAELADAVLEEGWSVTRTALDRITKEPTSPLRTLIDLTLELARLMEENVSVRSAARLAQELPTAPPWSGSWLPAVRELLDEAHRTGQLREDALPTDVTVLVEHLTSGAEAYLRNRLASESEYESVVARLERVWRLVLVGVAAAGVPEPPEPRSARN